MPLCSTLLLLFLATFQASLADDRSVDGAAPEFDFIRIEGEEPGPTLLVIGGIQGDEPGGFNAASLLATRYAVERGALWVVPNLNFASILRRSRGVHGDMNRKFPSPASSDPDFERVERIKAIITDPRVGYVFNLHDGSGFFRPRHVDKLHNPRRWGQSIIIDQARIGVRENGDLQALAERVREAVNRTLHSDEHVFNIKNTRTRKGNQEMAKTLTYFAINNGKPAVGLEASKSLPTHLRVFYHLSLLEAYMRELGVSARRHFDLTPGAVEAAVNDDVQVALYNARIMLDVSDSRKVLRYVPLKKDARVTYTATNPLVAIVPGKKDYAVRYGNRRVTELHPQFFEYDERLVGIRVKVDGVERDVEFGSAVPVEDHFEVLPHEGLRTNVIGFRISGKRDEAGVRVRRRDLPERFSIDRSGTTFRVEIYRGERFAGMVLVRFPGAKRASKRSKRRPLT